LEHRAYGSIVGAVRTGRLREPFSKQDFSRVCPGFGRGTYQAFLSKHALGNPGGASELFERVAPGRYRCVRPFKYGL
jgi:hypothetical protein